MADTLNTFPKLGTWDYYDADDLLAGAADTFENLRTKPSSVDVMFIRYNHGYPKRFSRKHCNNTYGEVWFNTTTETFEILCSTDETLKNSKLIQEIIECFYLENCKVIAKSFPENYFEITEIDFVD